MHEGADTSGGGAATAGSRRTRASQRLQQRQRQGHGQDSAQQGERDRGGTAAHGGMGMTGTGGGEETRSGHGAGPCGSGAAREAGRGTKRRRDGHGSGSEGEAPLGQPSVGGSHSPEAVAAGPEPETRVLRAPAAPPPASAPCVVGVPLPPAEQLTVLQQLLLAGPAPLAGPLPAAALPAPPAMLHAPWAGAGRGAALATASTPPSCSTSTQSTSAPQAPTGPMAGLAPGQEAWSGPSSAPASDAGAGASPLPPGRRRPRKQAAPMSGAGQGLLLPLRPRASGGGSQHWCAPHDRDSDSGDDGASQPERAASRQATPSEDAGPAAPRRSGRSHRAPRTGDFFWGGDAALACGNQVDRIGRQQEAQPARSRQGSPASRAAAEHGCGGSGGGGGGGGGGGTPAGSPLAGRARSGAGAPASSGAGHVAAAAALAAAAPAAHPPMHVARAAAAGPRRFCGAAVSAPGSRASSVGSRLGPGGGQRDAGLRALLPFLMLSHPEPTSAAAVTAGAAADQEPLAPAAMETVAGVGAAAAAAAPPVPLAPAACQPAAGDPASPTAGLLLCTEAVDEGAEPGALHPVAGSLEQPAELAGAPPAAAGPAGGVGFVKLLPPSGGAWAGGGQLQLVFRSGPLSMSSPGPGKQLPASCGSPPPQPRQACCQEWEWEGAQLAAAAPAVVHPLAATCDPQAMAQPGARPATPQGRGACEAPCPFAEDLQPPDQRAGLDLLLQAGALLQGEGKPVSVQRTPAVRRAASPCLGGAELARPPAAAGAAAGVDAAPPALPEASPGALAALEAEVAARAAAELALA
jgi:hypothetical protein